MSEAAGTGDDRKTTELKERLQEHINAAQRKLEELRNDLASLREGDREALREKSEELHRRVEEQKARAKQLRADLRSWEKEKVAHTRDAVAGWRQRRELHKLQSRANRAEDYAMRAVVIAAIDFEEAEQAVLDALTARFDAELAATP
jgi:vacuolar-type H+-ATPase subunit I/STV1